MSNEIVKYKWQGQELEISSSIIRNRIATSKNVTDKEVDEFMDLCVYRNLNPYLKEAYLIKYGTERANIVTSKDVFDKRAFRDPKFDGEEITDNYKRGMNLMDLWVRTKIYHQGLSHPASDVTVHYPEYVGRKKDGTINRMWLTKPVTMLTKVSKAQAKREANPEDMAGLYLTEEFDQRSKPTEKVIREVDIPLKKEDKVVNAEFVEEEKVDRNDEAIEEVKAIEEEKIEQKAEVAEQEEVVNENERLASTAQKDYIYGINICNKCKARVHGFKCGCGSKDLKIVQKGIIHSSYITKKEIINKIGNPKELIMATASEILAWWWGDKDKNIVGEREKRGKNPKTGDTDLERRNELMREVLDLFKKNFLHKPMQKKFYKKYQKSDIKELAYEELVELKASLEHYVPENW